VAVVHDARMHADMRRQLMHHNEFLFDRVFSEIATNDEVYLEAAAPLIRLAANGGYTTCLMYLSIQFVALWLHKFGICFGLWLC
jgi:hypothetical protein